MKDLINIKYWIFDLDNTLYSGQTQVFSEVDKKNERIYIEENECGFSQSKRNTKKIFL